MQFAVHIGASNEGLQRFHNHGEGPYYGLLRENGERAEQTVSLVFTAIMRGTE